MLNSTRDRPILFNVYPGLAQHVPWVSLGDWPTPVASVPNFARAHKLAACYVKREDLSHAECGGNKIRGLEFLIAAARRRRADTLVTSGAVGSQHVSRTAWHGHRHHLRTVAVVVKQPPADYVAANLQTAMSAGVEYVAANMISVAPKLFWQILKRRARAYYVPPGGTSPLACLGHVNAVLELKQQISAGLLPPPDYLFTALGSLGTAAGLAVGCKLAGLPTRLVGVVVSYRWYCTPGRWARLARRTLRLIRRLEPALPEAVIDPTELTVVGSALGHGFAHKTASAMALARGFYEQERICLDTTYSAKVLDGALEFIRAAKLQNCAHLLWHGFQDIDPGTGVPPLDLPKMIRRYLPATPRDVPANDRRPPPGTEARTA